jgi:hypothetical protein
MSKATGQPVSVVTLSKEERLAQPWGDVGYRSEVWNNVEGYKVDLDAVRAWGLRLPHSISSSKKTATSS